MFKKGQTIILDGLEYEVIDFGNVYWDGKLHKDSYALWCNEGDTIETSGYGRIEKRSYVEENAK
jgi:hypothetical protein